MKRCKVEKASGNGKVTNDKVVVSNENIIVLDH
jgi:hypothetical protein